jgi:hypothetical protein
VEPHLEHAVKDSDFCCAEEVTARFVELKITSVIVSRFREATIIKPVRGNSLSITHNLSVRAQKIFEV